MKAWEQQDIQEKNVFSLNYTDTGRNVKLIQTDKNNCTQKDEFYNSKEINCITLWAKKESLSLSLYLYFIFLVLILRKTPFGELSPSKAFWLWGQKEGKSFC